MLKKLLKQKQQANSNSISQSDGNRTNNSSFNALPAQNGSTQINGASTTKKVKKIIKKKKEKEEEFEDEAKAKTLIDVLLERFEEKDKKIHSHVFFSGKKNKDETVFPIFDKIYLDAKLKVVSVTVSENEVSDLVGVLLETNSNYVHLLEGEMENVHKFIYNFCKFIESSENDKLDKDVKILHYQDDLRDVSFKSWMKSYVNASNGSEEEELRKEGDDETKESYWERGISEMCQKLLAGGRHFKESASFSEQKFQKEFLLQEQTIRTLSECKFCLNLAEFVDIFIMSPGNYNLEEDFVYPVNSSVNSAFFDQDL